MQCGSFQKCWFISDSTSSQREKEGKGSVACAAFVESSWLYSTLVVCVFWALNESKKDSLGEKARTGLAVHRKLGVVSHEHVQKRKKLILLGR